jgi:hypothetical protein
VIGYYYYYYYYYYCCYYVCYTLLHGMLSTNQGRNLCLKLEVYVEFIIIIIVIIIIINYIYIKCTASVVSGQSFWLQIRRSRV